MEAGSSLRLIHSISNKWALPVVLARSISLNSFSDKLHCDCAALTWDKYSIIHISFSFLAPANLWLPVGNNFMQSALCRGVSRVGTGEKCVGASTF